MAELIVVCRYIKIAFFIFWVVGGYMIWLWHFVKCKGIRDCHNKKCMYRNYCFRYKESITEEEAETLLKFLDTLGDK